MLCQITTLRKITTQNHNVAQNHDVARNYDVAQNCSIAQNYNAPQRNLHSLSLLNCGHLQNTTASVEYFQRLLDDNPMTFHPYRTAKSSMEHWLQMKHYQLLDDQTSQNTSHCNITVIIMTLSVLKRFLASIGYHPPVRLLKH